MEVHFANIRNHFVKMKGSQLDSKELPEKNLHLLSYTVTQLFFISIHLSCLAGFSQQGFVSSADYLGLK